MIIHNKRKHALIINNDKNTDGNSIRKECSVGETLKQNTEAINRIEQKILIINKITFALVLFFE